MVCASFINLFLCAFIVEISNNFTLIFFPKLLLFSSFPIKGFFNFFFSILMKIMGIMGLLKGREGLFPQNLNFKFQTEAGPNNTQTFLPSLLFM